jgi:hypothetical protein
MTIVTEDELVRARVDTEFRRQLLGQHLDRLLAALNHARRVGDLSKESVQKIREGADLAVQLAERLHET